MTTNIHQLAEESVQDYTSHVVKDNDGLVICPVLHNYVCPICKATGFFAHTVKHCPRNEGETMAHNGMTKPNLASSREPKKATSTGQGMGQVGRILRAKARRVTSNQIQKVFIRMLVNGV